MTAEITKVQTTVEPLGRLKPMNLTKKGETQKELVSKEVVLGVRLYQSYCQLFKPVLKAVFLNWGNKGLAYNLTFKELPTSLSGQLKTIVK